MLLSNPAQYSPRDVRRVAAKIAYGLFRLATGFELDRDADHKLRTYILGETDGDPEPVAEAPETLPLITGGTPHHSVILGPQHDPEGAVVRLYGYGFRVALGSGGRRLEQPVVVLCNTDGSGMRTADARKILDHPEDDTTDGRRDRAILSVGLQVGLRRAEIAALKVGDLHQNRGYDSLRVVRKGGRRDALAIHPQTAQRIRAYLELAGHGDDLEGPLFPAAQPQSQNAGDAPPHGPGRH